LQEVRGLTAPLFFCFKMGVSILEIAKNESGKSLCKNCATLRFFCAKNTRFVQKITTFLTFLFRYADIRKTPVLQGFEVVARVGFEPTTRGL
jgi:hypothetical protein